MAKRNSPRPARSHRHGCSRTFVPASRGFVDRLAAGGASLTQLGAAATRPRRRLPVCPSCSPAERTPSTCSCRRTRRAARARPHRPGAGLHAAPLRAHQRSSLRRASGPGALAALRRRTRLGRRRRLSRRTDVGGAARRDRARAAGLTRTRTRSSSGRRPSPRISSGVGGSPTTVAYAGSTARRCAERRCADARASRAKSSRSSRRWTSCSPRPPTSATRAYASASPTPARGRCVPFGDRRHRAGGHLRRSVLPQHGAHRARDRRAWRPRRDPADLLRDLWLDRHDEVINAQAAMRAPRRGPGRVPGRDDHRYARRRHDVHDQRLRALLTSNGRGSDHDRARTPARGGQIFGVPALAAGALDTGRGRFVPTTSVDAFCADLALVRPDVERAAGGRTSHASTIRPRPTPWAFSADGGLRFWRTARSQARGARMPRHWSVHHAPAARHARSSRRERLGSSTRSRSARRGDLHAVPAAGHEPDRLPGPAPCAHGGVLPDAGLRHSSMPGASSSPCMRASPRSRRDLRPLISCSSVGMDAASAFGPNIDFLGRARQRRGCRRVQPGLRPAGGAPSTRSDRLSWRRTGRWSCRRRPRRGGMSDRCTRRDARPGRHTIQTGIGSIPAAASALDEHSDRACTAGSSMTPASILERGVLTGDQKAIDREQHVVGARRRSMRAWRIARRHLRPRYTHEVSVIAELDRFVSINSAVEVDLLGQVSAEMVGGAADLRHRRVRRLHARRPVPGGRSIVAMTAVARGGGCADRARAARRYGRRRRHGRRLRGGEFGIAHLNHVDARAGR